LVKLIVEVIEPDYGMILDPACGAGGMFVQSAVRIRNKLNQDPNKVISVYGQEKVDGTVKLCQMNLAVHGVSGLRNIREGNTYYQDIHNSATYDQDAQDSIGAFDFVMANPPFNVNGVDREKIKSDRAHYPFGVPSVDNANYLWIELFYSALNQNGRAGFVMANSASDARGSELEIRRQLIEKGAVDVMIAIGSNFFYTVTLPCTLWFLDRGKVKTPRKEKVLFIDARHIYRQVDRAHRDFSEQQVEFIANIVRLYRGEAVEVTGAESEMLSETFPEGAYRDVAGLCKVATLAEIEAQGWSLNPGRYVGSLDYVDINPPAGFKAIQLGDIADLSTGINLARDGKSTNNSASKKAYLLTAQNIQSDGSLNLDTARKIDIAAITDTGQEEKVNKLLLKPNDILLARIGTRGNHKVAIVPDDLIELVTYADSLIIVRVNPNLATAKTCLHSYSLIVVKFHYKSLFQAFLYKEFQFKISSDFGFFTRETS
jgi:type I restriction-modification system DNA methylase subunit